MTIAGIVPLYHGITKFTNSWYSAASIAEGGDAFSAFAAFKLRTLDEPEIDALIFGNRDGDNGYGIFRAGSHDTAEFVFFKAVIGDVSVFIPVDRSVALGRTFFIEIVGDDDQARVYLNGGLYAEEAATLVASSQEIYVGGGLTFNSVEQSISIIACGYRDGIDNTSTIETIWENFKSRGSFPVSSYHYVWIARVLNPSNATDVSGPETWVNSGTVGAPGNLTSGFDSEIGDDVHDYITDVRPDFGVTTTYLTTLETATDTYAITELKTTFVADIELAVAANATTPNPGYVGVEIRSSITGGMLRWDGTAWRAPGYAGGNPITNVRTITFGEEEYDNGNSGSAITVDWNNGQMQLLTLTDNCTLSFTDPPGIGTFSLRIVNTGSFTLDQPVSVKTQGGTTYPPTPNGEDIFVYQFRGASPGYFLNAAQDWQTP